MVLRRELWRGGRDTLYIFCPVKDCTQKCIDYKDLRKHLAEEHPNKFKQRRLRF